MEHDGLDIYREANLHELTTFTWNTTYTGLTRLSEVFMYQLCQFGQQLEISDPIPWHSTLCQYALGNNYTAQALTALERLCSDCDIAQNRGTHH